MSTRARASSSLYFVQTTIEVNDDLSAAMIVDDFEFTDVTLNERSGDEARADERLLTMFHHHSEKFDDHFRAWSNDHLTFVTFLSVVNRFERIGKDVHVHHDVDLSIELCARTRESEDEEEEDKEENMEHRLLSYK